MLKHMSVGTHRLQTQELRRHVFPLWSARRPYSLLSKGPFERERETSKRSRCRETLVTARSSPNGRRSAVVNCELQCVP
jgi:hypothetical protein